MAAKLGLAAAQRFRLEAAIWNVWRIKATALPLINRSFGAWTCELGCRFFASLIVPPEIQCAKPIAINIRPSVTASFALIDNQIAFTVELFHYRRIYISDRRESRIGFATPRVAEVPGAINAARCNDQKWDQEHEWGLSTHLFHSPEHTEFVNGNNVVVSGQSALSAQYLKADTTSAVRTGSNFPTPHNCDRRRAWPLLRRFAPASPHQGDAG